VATGTRHGTKILVVCAVDTTAWILLVNQIRAIRQRGWEVGVACTDGPMLRRLAAEGIPIYPVYISRSFAPMRNLAAVIRLYRILRGHSFDIVHVHTPVASLVGRLAARLAGVPIVLYTAHGFYFHEHMNPRARFLHIRIERLFGRWTDFLFTQSAEDAATAIAERIVPAAKVETIGNGVVISDFADVPRSAVEGWRERLNLPRDSIVIGTVGRLVREKGYGEFFLAASRVAASQPSAVFLVVGDVAKGDRDPFSATIVEALASDPKLRDRVRFAGFTEEIPPLMQLMDIFVLASYREGMPRSIIEAMAAGKPVIASDIRGCREEVVHGVTGFLVPVRDAPALASCIETLVKDPDLRREQGLAGRLRAERFFDETKVIERLMERIDKLLEERDRIQQQASH
jgi:glycosyltransferase involved in cell wall biosynthesis